MRTQKTFGELERGTQFFAEPEGGDAWVKHTLGHARPVDDGRPIALAPDQTVWVEEG